MGPSCLLRHADRSVSPAIKLWRRRPWPMGDVWNVVFLFIFEEIAERKTVKREREMFSLFFLFLSTYFQIGSATPSIVSYFEYKYSSIISFESSSNCSSSSLLRWLPVQVRTSSLPSDRRLFDLWHYNSRLQNHVCRALPCHASRDDQSTIFILSAWERSELFIVGQWHIIWRRLNNHNSVFIYMPPIDLNTENNSPARCEDLFQQDQFLDEGYVSWSREDLVQGLKQRWNVFLDLISVPRTHVYDRDGWEDAYSRVCVLNLSIITGHFQVPDGCLQNSSCLSCTTKSHRWVHA